MNPLIARGKEAFRKSQRRLLRKARIEANSEAFFRLVPEESPFRLVATGFLFTEGPLWNDTDKSLFFSDIPGNRIYRLADGRVEVFREESGNSNGLTLDREGRLLVCEHRGRRVTRIEPDGSVTVLADRFDGKRLNSPNDIVVKSDGSIYFTDPPFGITASEQELPFSGLYRLSPDGQNLALLADDLDRPNGLAFSPDEGNLYVDDSWAGIIRVYDVLHGGTIANGRLFTRLDSGRPGAPDGMKVDSLGNLYCTGPGGVWVFNAEGIHLGTVLTPEPASNCAWGGADRKILFITATSSVYRLETVVTGIAVNSSGTKGEAR
jgi:gluconolactonase